MTNAAVTVDHSRRRHDLDWLRVIAFGLLIFYHIGMFYVTWDWHVKSPHAGPAAELPMMLVNPWRLSLLFFISGIAIRFASDKTPAARFFASRSFRLGLPIIFGMAVIVAPQPYFELRQAGQIGADPLGYYINYLDLVQAYPITTPTWNHLWYIVYLLVYTWLLCLLLPVFRLGKGAIERFVAFISGGAKRPWLVLALPVIPFLLYRFTLVPHFPTTHALVGDWANHATSLTIFLLGYVVAKSDAFWTATRRMWPLVSGLLLVSVPILGYFWVNWASLEPDTPLMNALRAWRIFYAWWVIVFLLGLGQRYFNRPSALLTYMTGAVFCWYILHQTITVSAGYYLARMQLPALTEFALLTAITIGGCLAGTELFRRIPGLRICMGLKGPANRSAASDPALSPLPTRS